MKLLIIMLLVVSSAVAEVYSCAMKCEVVPHPGKCSKCGMDLRVAQRSGPSTRPGSPLDLPDIEIYDQNGTKRRFHSDLLKGRTVAINFIFTTCTTICPPLTATFRKVQQSLAGSDVRLISVTVDPAVDTPERLKKYSEQFGAGPGWTFVTGPPEHIDRLLGALGAAVTDKTSHTPMVLILNEPAKYFTRANGLSATKLQAAIAATAKR